MKLLLCFFLFVGMTATAFGAQDYCRQFDNQWNQQDFSAMEKTLSDWHRAQPKDLEWYVASGKFFAEKGRRAAPLLAQTQGTPTPVVRCPHPTPDSDPHRDHKRFNQAFLKKAAGFWKTALQNFPERLDLSFCLALLYQDMGDFESQYGTLAQTLQYADKNGKKLTWEGGQDLPEPTSQFIPEWFQEPIAYYLGQDDPQEREKALRLCRLTMTFFPGDPYAYNSIAAYFSEKEDWPRTLKYLLLANAKAPKDSLILCNIGNTLDRIGKKRESRIYYRRVVRLNQDPESVEIARSHLDPKK